ncbi:MAG: hypothetical protein FWC23_09215 [Chitinispirillia bacterium]|nr:hypothetical protein [Chitinispirillia bacterium]MCL2269348.1 hypothetical protein [Chitinispirillia bacterium]
MKRIGSAVLSAVVLALAIGCGGGEGLGIKEGDELVLGERLERARFDASYGELNDKGKIEIKSNDGAHVEVPEGTVFKVLVTPRREAKTIEVVPIKTTKEFVLEDGTAEKREITDETEIRDFFVHSRFREGERFEDGRTAPFLYYSFSFDAAMLGNQLKKKE